MKPKLTKDHILHFLAELKSDLYAHGIEKVALFGSYATQNQNVYSDIDIAIQKKKDFLENHSAYDYFDIVAMIKSKVLKKLHKSSDVFDLDSISEFKKDIEKELIYV
jgi:predicted nucleotidyltransferase